MTQITICKYKILVNIQINELIFELILIYIYIYYKILLSSILGEMHNHYINFNEKNIKAYLCLLSFRSIVECFSFFCLHMVSRMFIFILLCFICFYACFILFLNYILLIVMYHLLNFTIKKMLLVFNAFCLQFCNFVQIMVKKNKY